MHLNTDNRSWILSVTIFTAINSPTGFVSKKRTGHLTTLLNILWCNVLAAFTRIWNVNRARTMPNMNTPAVIAE